MGDRGRGRGPRPDFGSRPLGRTQDYTGRGPLGGRGATGATRPLGQSAPVRTSSGGLSTSALGGLSSSLAGAAAAAGAAASGRGAGPDHREVRYADGVLAMINVLRLLTLGGPRTWDVAAYKQVGMHVAVRPGVGVAGREVSLLVNHFAVSIRPGANMTVYKLKAQRFRNDEQEIGESSTTTAAAAAAAAAGEKPLPRAVLRRILEQLAAGEEWPAGSWVLVGNDRLAVSSSSSSMISSTNTARTAVVQLQEQQQQQQPGGSKEPAAAGDSSGGSFQVTLSPLGKHDVNNLRAAAAVDAAGNSVPLLDGIQLLEALLLAAVLQQSSSSSTAAAASPRDSSSPAAAAAGGGGLAGSLGSSGSGLMGLAAVASSGGSAPQQGLLSAGIAAAAQIGSPTSAAAAPAAGISITTPATTGSGTLTIPAGLAAATRIAMGDAVYLHAPGNAEVHAQLGRGVEAWLGFKQHVVVTQSGPAAVVDLTAAPFFEPGLLLAAVPVLLGQPAAAAVTENGDVGALVSAEAVSTSAAAAAAAGGGVVSALSTVERLRLENILRGVKVEVSVPGKSAKLVTINCLSATAAEQTTFVISSSSSSTTSALPAGSEVSVAAYFKAVYDIQLQAPHLPCIGVARPGSSSSGANADQQQQQQQSSSTDIIWYPLELCRLPIGQRYLAPLDATQLSALARLAAKKSSDRRIWLELIMAAPAAAAPAAATGAQPVPVPGASEPLAAAATSSSSGGGSASYSSPLPAAGVDVCGVLGVVRGRVLPAPHLAYQNPECCYPGSQGQWNVRACRLPGSSKIISWCLVVLLPQSEVDVEGPSGVVPFMQDLVSSLNSNGVECSMPPILYEQADLSVLQHLKAGCEAAQKHFDASADLLLVMLASRSAALYQEVKLASDAVLGLPSQVLVAAAAGVGSKAQPRGRLQYCANLGLKINAKMGGVNVRLAGNSDQVIPVIGARPFILFGVALAPPAVNAAAGSPAAAAVVASRDRSLGRYSSRVLLQPWNWHHQQHSCSSSSSDNGSSSVSSAPHGVVAGLKAAARELLIDFYRQNGGRKPEALLCYRAVSNEGQQQQQQQQMLEFEYQALRAACFELEESYCPPITYVTVNRSHGTRLFPADRDNQDKAGNCLPGTVVDSGICHPTQFDFFLNSHAGLQGHNKPAHYHVLVDENGFSADSLQLFTYWLCYLYCRCSRSVSVVPPAYYAQLAAARGRLLSAGRDQLAVEAEGNAALAAEAADIGLDFDVKVNAKLGGSMYYV